MFEGGAGPQATMAQQQPMGGFGMQQRQQPMMGMQQQQPMMGQPGMQGNMYR